MRMRSDLLRGSLQESPGQPLARKARDPLCKQGTISNSRGQDPYVQVKEDKKKERSRGARPGQESSDCLEHGGASHTEKEGVIGPCGQAGQTWGLRAAKSRACRQSWGGRAADICNAPTRAG